jgi:hypothetical protein
MASGSWIFISSRKELVRDCARYLANTYGEGWSLKPRRSKDSSQGKMSCDQQAITSMLWHLYHTSWFKFNAGSQLVYF